MNNQTGLLLVNKAANKTSFSLVSILRKLTNIKKIGHAGTLDPFATGLMIMLIGKDYTKKSDKFINHDKEYLCTLHLGYTTETFDTESEKVLVSKKVPTFDEIKKVIDLFQGEQKQIPPMYSAKKIKGQKLYDLARKGISIKREPINVNIEIKIEDYSYPHLDLKVSSSKGTYIRTLANDIGEKLETGAYLTKLIRTRCGPFHLKDAIDQEKLSTNINLTPLLIK